MFKSLLLARLQPGGCWLNEDKKSYNEVGGDKQCHVSFISQKSINFFITFFANVYVNVSVSHHAQNFIEQEFRIISLD